MNNQIHSSLEADGVLLATIDMPGRSMNVFSVDLMDALDALMDQVDNDPAVRSVVLTSGKSAFLAGADLVMVQGFTRASATLNEEQMFTLCGRLGRQFVRLESSTKPWVAAVNGIALGGGLELAMACRARIVADHPKILLGLPEVRWGLLPGAGGTQRLPRLAGFDAGLSLLLTGRPMAPAEAVERGVFAKAVPADRLLDEARALSRELRHLPDTPAAKFPHLTQADVPAHSADAVWALAQKHGVSEADFQAYPAYGVIIDCVLLGARHPLAEASAVEMRQFLRLMADPVAGNMVRSLFLNRQKADRELAAPDGLRIEHVTIGPLPPALMSLQALLDKSRLPLHHDASLPPSTLQLTDTRGTVHDVRVGALGAEAADAAASPTASALLSAAGAYGSVLEIQTASDATAQALAALAPRLGGALPYRVNGPVLQPLARAGRESLDAQAVLAVRLVADGSAPNAAQLDVAACAAGVSPAWTGGPICHFWRHRERLAPQLEASVWKTLAPTLQAACA